MHAPMTAPVVFLHLPKTGGSTLRDFIEPNMSRSFRFYNPRAWTAFRMRDDLNRFDFFSGHFNFGVQSYLVLKKNLSRPRVITVLRNPIERVVSAYRFHRIDLAWSDCLQSGQGLCVEYENDMVKRLSGIGPINGFDQSAMNRAIPYGTTTELHLELAKENLEACDAIAICERFKESLDHLEKLFGWRGDKSLHRNRSRAPEGPLVPADIDADTLSLIKQYNSLDLQLYEHGLQLFDRQRGRLS